MVRNFGSTKAELHSGVNSLSANGGTSVNSGLTLGVNQLIGHSSQNKKVAILICDGDVDSVTSIVDKAVKNNIAIYTINVVSSSQSTLEWIAKQTGGEYYHAYTAEQLLDAFSHITSDNLFDFSLTDSDQDGLPDTFETNGMRTSNGQIIYTNPLKYDTDGDGISDGDEMGILRSGVKLDTKYEPIPENGLYLGDGTYIKSTFYFDWKSNPLKLDTDGDGINDKDDPKPFVFNNFEVLGKGKYGSLAYNGELYPIEVPNHLKTVIDANWTTVSVKPISSLEFNFAKFIAGTEFEQTRPQSPIYAGPIILAGTEQKTLLGAAGVICGVLNSLQNSINSVYVEFIFQKSGENNRVIIGAGSALARSYFDVYAGSIPYSAYINNTGSPLSQAIISTTVANYYKNLTGQNVDYGTYDMQISIDGRHKDNKFSSYLWINGESTIMEIPVVYSNDKVELGKREIFSFKPLLNLGTGVSSPASDSFQNLFGQIYDKVS